MSENKEHPDIILVTNSKIFPEDLIEQIKKDLGVVPNLKEQGNARLVENINFNFDMVSTNEDLKALIQKLKKSKTKQYSLLLYGVSGSGKTYFGQYLAQILGMKVIKKRASDLTDRFVGQTEKNIRAAFAEARENDAILIFDEADSFLFDRKNAKQDFQVSSVNEMLTQMEDHPLPFICTTNLKEGLDKASLRRFIFKIKYDYMKENNILAGVKEYFGIEIDKKDLESKDLENLCPGDFVVAKKKLDILEGKKYSKPKILEYLKKEQEEKDIEKSKKIGF